MSFPSNIKDLHISGSFAMGYKGEVEEEVKGRATSIFSVVMLQNLNDY